jgi:gas vesicle protein
MPNWGGGASGALTGASYGSMFGPIGTGVGAAVGGIAGLFGGGKSPEEKMAAENLRQKMAREQQFWKQAQGQMGKAQNYFAPIAGGSRTAAMETMAPELSAGVQRMDAGRQSLLNTSSRSGGAASQIDPYAKSAFVTNSLLKARPQAAEAMIRMAGTTGGWAQDQGGAGKSMMDYSKELYAREQEKGKAFSNQLNEFMGSDMMKGWGGKFKGWAGGKGKNTDAAWTGD